MIIQILLIISIVLQLSAASVAIGLIRKTKYNLSWMLFTIALVGLAFTRFGEYIQIANWQNLRHAAEFTVWLGIITSFCFAAGLFLVQRMLKYIYRTEAERRITERRILNTILRTEENERQRFSKDLHDGLGPLLSSAKMSISALSLSKEDKRNRIILENTAIVIDEAIRTVREVSVNLSPHVLKDFGLSRALTNFMNRLPRNEVEINLQTNLKDERFDIDIEVILYRVICELINNSLKHANATKLTILLQKNPTEIEVCYRDNGVGFDLKEAHHKGMGLSNMTSRIRSIKGKIELHSAPTKGMRAEIHTPI